MRDDDVDVVLGQAGLVEDPSHCRPELANGQLERLAAPHAHVVLARRYGFWGGRPGGGATGDPDGIRGGRLGGHLDAQRSARPVGGGQDRGPRAVAEQDAGTSIGEVGAAAHRLGADDQGVLAQPGRQIGVGHGVAEDIAGTGGREIHGRGADVADGFLDQHRGRRQRVVRRERADQDEIDVVRREAGRGDRPQAGDRGHAGRGLARSGDPAFSDAGPGGDPLVAGLDHALEIVVAQNQARGVRAPAGHIDST